MKAESSCKASSCGTLLSIWRYILNVLNFNHIGASIRRSFAWSSLSFTRHLTILHPPWRINMQMCMLFHIHMTNQKPDFFFTGIKPAEILYWFHWGDHADLACPSARIRMLENDITTGYTHGTGKALRNSRAHLDICLILLLYALTKILSVGDWTKSMISAGSVSSPPYWSCRLVTRHRRRFPPWQESIILQNHMVWLCVWALVLSTLVNIWSLSSQKDCQQWI